MKNLFCPISDERINEQVARITALYIIITVIVAFASDSLAVMGFIVADFFIRAFTKMKFSPLSCLAYWTTQLFKLPVKQIDKAPKTFAARMGFIMTLAFTVLFAVKLYVASVVVAGVLVLFAGLEYTIAFCAGCSIYTYFVLPFYKN